MKPTHITKRLPQWGSGIMAAGLLILALAFPSSTYARNNISGLTSNKEEIEHYVKQKYNIKDTPLLEAVRIDIRKDAPYEWRRVGISSREYIYQSEADRHFLQSFGDYTPAKVAGHGLRPGKESQDARAIAQAFFAEEAELLELTPDSEMKEDTTRQDYQEKGAPDVTRSENGGYALEYHHYINGVRLENTDTYIGITADGKVTGFSAGIIPITPEMLAAIKAPRLSKKEINQIAIKDMKAEVDNQSLNSLAEVKGGAVPVKSVAIASPAPPYIKWEVQSYFIYIIDGFTGQILNRYRDIQTSKPPRR